MPSGSSFNHDTVSLDGETFEDCDFQDCRLVYAGGPPPVFISCRFVACDWRMEDAAARTLAQLKVMWGAGAKAQVQALIKEVTGAAR